MSTNNALLSITEYIQAQLDEEKYYAGALAHLKKAIDTVDRNILLRKLDHYGRRDLAN